MEKLTNEEKAARTEQARHERQAREREKLRLRCIAAIGGRHGKGSKKPRKPRSEYKATWGRPKGEKTGLQASASNPVLPPCEDKGQPGITIPDGIQRLLEEGKTLKEAQSELNAVNQ